MTEKQKMLRSAVFMCLIIAVAKISGMLRDVFIAAAFGTSDAAVAYETASKLPTSIFDIVLGGIIAAAFIPVFSGLLVSSPDKKAAYEYADNYISFILCVSVVLSVFGVIFSGVLVGLVAPDVSGEVKILAASLSRIMFPSVIFTSTAFCMVGVLQSCGRFLIPASISIVSNVIMIAYLALFSDKYGVRGLAVAMLAGWVAQAAVQIPSLIAVKFRFRFRLDFKSPHLLSTLKNALPILAATWTTPLSSLVMTALASSIAGGRAITALGYANRLFVLLTGMFSFIATNLLFPYMSRAAASGRESEAKLLTRDSLTLLCAVVLPISAGLFALTEPIVSFIYVRGEFTPSDAALTSAALRFYALGMAGSAINEVMTKALFARKVTREPMYAAFISMAFNIAAAYLLTPRLGIAGIAVACAVSATLSATLNGFMAYRKGYVALGAYGAASFLYTLASSAVMGAGVFLLHGKLTAAFSPTVALVLTVLAGMVFYGVLMLPVLWRLFKGGTDK